MAASLAAAATRSRKSISASNGGALAVNRKRTKRPKRDPWIQQGICLAMLILLAIFVFFFVSAFHFRVQQPPPPQPDYPDPRDDHQSRVDYDRLLRRSIARPGDTKEDAARNKGGINHVVVPKHQAFDSVSSAKKKSGEVLVLSTNMGDLRILLRPDLSQLSVDYIHSMVKETKSSPCQECKFYRAEKPGILQGIIAQPNVVPTVEQKGGCPEQYQNIINNCPDYDAQCGCHGPVMTKGMVGWAGGKTGPDFFIDNYVNPATHWGTQHTVFGQVADNSTFDLLAAIFELPTRKQGLTYLQQALHFAMRIETIE